MLIPPPLQNIDVLNGLYQHLPSAEKLCPSEEIVELFKNHMDQTGLPVALGFSMAGALMGKGTFQKFAINLFRFTLGLKMLTDLRLRLYEDLSNATCISTTALFAVAAYIEITKRQRENKDKEAESSATLAQLQPAPPASQPQKENEGTSNGNQQPPEGEESAKDSTPARTDDSTPPKGEKETPVIKTLPDSALSSKKLSDASSKKNKENQKLNDTFSSQGFQVVGRRGRIIGQRQEKEQQLPQSPSTPDLTKLSTLPQLPRSKTQPKVNTSSRTLGGSAKPDAGKIVQPRTSYNTGGKEKENTQPQQQLPNFQDTLQFPSIKESLLKNLPQPRPPKSTPVLSAISENKQNNATTVQEALKPLPIAPPNTPEKTTNIQPKETPQVETQEDAVLGHSEEKTEVTSLPLEVPPPVVENTTEEEKGGVSEQEHESSNADAGLEGNNSHEDEKKEDDLKHTTRQRPLRNQTLRPKSRKKVPETPEKKADTSAPEPSKNSVVAENPAALTVFSVRKNRKQTEGFKFKDDSWENVLQEAMARKNERGNFDQEHVVPPVELQQLSEAVKGIISNIETASTDQGTNIANSSAQEGATPHVEVQPLSTHPTGIFSRFGKPSLPSSKQQKDGILNSLPSPDSKGAVRRLDNFKLEGFDYKNFHKEGKKQNSPKKVSRYSPYKNASPSKSKQSVTGQLDATAKQLLKRIDDSFGPAKTSDTAHEPQPGHSPMRSPVRIGMGSPEPTDSTQSRSKGPYTSASPTSERDFNRRGSNLIMRKKISQEPKERTPKNDGLTTIPSTSPKVSQEPEGNTPWTESGSNTLPCPTTPPRHSVSSSTASARYNVPYPTNSNKPLASASPKLVFTPPGNKAVNSSSIPATNTAEEGDKKKTSEVSLLFDRVVNGIKNGAKVEIEAIKKGGPLAIFD